jgi:hypothetical protein
MSEKAKLTAYRIPNDMLPEATDAMNHVDGDGLFESHVRNIIPGDQFSIVVVEILGFYPFITNQWEKFWKEPSDAQATVLQNT